MRKLIPFLFLIFTAAVSAAGDFVRRDFPEMGVYVLIPQGSNLKTNVSSGDGRIIFSLDVQSKGAPYRVVGVFESGVGHDKWSSQPLILDEFMKGSTRTGHTMYVINKWDTNKWNKVVDKDPDGKEVIGWVRIKRVAAIGISSDPGYFIMKIQGTSDNSEFPEFADKTFDSFSPVAKKNKKK